MARLIISSLYSGVRPAETQQWNRIRFIDLTIFLDQVSLWFLESETV